MTKTRDIAQKPMWGGRPCTERRKDTRFCNIEKPCPKDCRASPWGKWSECSAQMCGFGRQTRTNLIIAREVAGGRPCGSNCHDTPNTPHGVCEDYRECGAENDCTMTFADKTGREVMLSLDAEARMTLSIAQDGILMAPASKAPSGCIAGTAIAPAVMPEAKDFSTLSNPNAGVRRVYPKAALESLGAATAEEAAAKMVVKKFCVVPGSLAELKRLNQ